MKKIINILVLLFVAFINIMYLSADCDYDKQAANIIKLDLQKISEFNNVELKVDIYNLNEEHLYAIVKNNYDDSELRFTSSDNNEFGYISFNSKNLNKNITYQIEIFSDRCPGNKLQNLTITTPKYNTYSILDVCTGKSNEIEECGAFFDTKDLTQEEFKKIIEDKIYKEKNKILVFIQKYYLYILIPFALISIIYLIRIILLKRGNKNE